MISKRLVQAAKYLEGFEFLADCGTDHGYLPIYALQNRLVKKAIASDNKQSPLRNAEENILYLGLEDQIELKLEDGLPYLDSRIDIVSILGMGGRLISRIISEADTSHLIRMVLSPNSEAEFLREYLENNHWRIVAEDFLSDKGKHYQIIVVEKGEMILNELEREFGPLIIKEKNECFRKYIERMINKFENAKQKIKDNEKSKTMDKRIRQLKEVIT